MMNFREAKQRLSVHRMAICFVQDSAPQEYRVSFPEDSYRDAEKSAYYTEDLEDAALTGAAMRRSRENGRTTAQAIRPANELRSKALGQSSVETQSVYVSVWSQ